MIVGLFGHRTLHLASVASIQFFAQALWCRYRPRPALGVKNRRGMLALTALTQKLMRSSFFGARVRFVIDLSQMLKVQVGVNLCGGNAAMS